MDQPLDLEAMVKKSDGDKPELRLWLRLLSTTNLLEQEVRRRLRASFGMTMPQFDVMAQLFREPEGLRLGALSQRLMVTNGNVTGLVERLCAEGLIERHLSPYDRRVSVVILSAHGRMLFAEMAQAHEEWLKELCADCETDFLVTLREKLKNLKQSILRNAANEPQPLANAAT